MGTSVTPTSQDRDLDLDAIRDWINANSRTLLISGAVVAVGVASVLFARQAAQIKNDKAEQAYSAAQGQYYSGNPTQAKSDLEKVVSRYSGTNGGTLGGMLLAQILYGEGKYDDGIKALTSLQSSAPSTFGPSIEELIAAGYADSKRPSDAATHYLKAADLSPYAAEKDMYRGDAARILMDTGKPADARAIWAKLAENPESPMATEAKIRLGEIDAKPAAP